MLSVGALAYAIIEGLDRRWLELRTDYAELRLPVADGVRVRTAEEQRSSARSGTSADACRGPSDLRRHPPLGSRQLRVPALLRPGRSPQSDSL